MTDPTPSTPVTIRDQMQMSLAALMGAGSQTLSALYAELANVNSQLTTVNAKIDDLAAQLDKVQAGLGAVPYEDLELTTVRGLLYALLQESALFGILPDGTAGLASTGSITDGGRRYVVWGAVPGLTLGNGGRELTPQLSWSGYQVYVQSDAPSFTLHDVTTPAQTIAEASVNSWVTLGGLNTLAMSVDSQYQVRGFMRYPATIDIDAIFADGAWRLPFPNIPSNWSYLVNPWYIGGDTSNPQLAVMVLSGSAQWGGQNYGGGGAYIASLNGIGVWSTPPRLSEWSVYSSNPFSARISYAGSPS